MVRKIFSWNYGKYDEIQQGTSVWFVSEKWQKIHFTMYRIEKRIVIGQLNLNIENFLPESTKIIKFAKIWFDNWNFLWNSWRLLLYNSTHLYINAFIQLIQPNIFPSTKFFLLCKLLHSSDKILKILLKILVPNRNLG